MIDSHHHLWNYSKTEYPWIPEGSPLAKSHLVPELETVTAESGVTGTIAVQARQTLDESDWLLSLTNQTELIKGVVGWAPLIAKDVFAELARLNTWEKFKGVRHVLQDEPDEYFLNSDFNRGLARVSRHKLTYDLLIFQRQIPIALQMVDQHENLQIIIDHIAKPEARDGRIEPDWKKGMQELAKRDHITGVKFSGLLTEFAKNQGSDESIAAYFHETLEIFGPDRVMFGTDWPVSLLRTNYKKWASQVSKLCETLSESERNSILRENAIRCYQLDCAE